MLVDPQFEHDLNRQPRDHWALAQLFAPEELQRLETARRGIDPARRTVAYAVYENPFARGGGIFAVARHLPPRLAKFNARVVILSPFHARLRGAPEQPGQTLETISVPYGGRQIPTTLYRVSSEGQEWILFGAEGFFAAEGDSPYNLPNERLLHDGLFASAAIPLVLQQLGLSRDVVVHIQDWQLAATALTVKQAVLRGQLDTVAVVLTSHNPYDCALEPAQWAAITDRTAWWQWARPEPEPDGSGTLPRGTVYECMMPLMDAPISTVSRQYARDLTTHPLQTDHFAGHLQTVLRRQGLVGVDNGLFMAPLRPFSEGAIREALAGDVQPILDQKAARRQLMLRALSSYRPPQSLGFLRHGDSWDLTGLPDRVPVFMMFGRMDPNQKGFDLLAAAIRRMPAGEAKFVICPIIPAGVEALVQYWRDVAWSRPGDVIVYTGRMDRYFETMAGASFCVMPSLHEPFGAATEPYLKGTPVVAHATGGLIQQVVDLASDPQRATGILFRATIEDEAAEAGRQWRTIMAEGDPAARMRSRQYVALVNGLVTALQQAADVYGCRHQAYGRMLARLYDQALRFSWEKAAAEYTRIYEKASGE